MLVNLSLNNFRSHRSLNFELSPAVTLLMGGNGVGKSSVIEAINLLATGSSFRAEKIEEMIRFDQDLARVQVGIKQVIANYQQKTDEILPNNTQLDQIDQLEIILTRGQVQGKKTPKKLFELNGARRLARATRGLVYAVVFRPEDLRLVEGSPSRRRQFLDEVLGQLSQDYHNSLAVYEKTLVRRNKILLAVRENEQPKTSLEYWNLSLVKHGQILQSKRHEFLRFCSAVDFPVKLAVEYLPSTIDSEILSQHLSREIAAGHTLIGPHKDDYVMSCDVENIKRGNWSDFKNVALYGSRGQQRLAVLWLKTCQLAYMTNQTQVRPMLLLDDILSELDTEAREFALSLMGAGQSLITTASAGIAQRISRSFTQIKQINLSS